eukprot:CAMPEP_0197034514 /NCGR_PEP_ID=MMETSP1384-20130603/12607_1 /TAXON_ID=29189 /ORGANISM="Ammonia sp." /LENGTH=338 /DNA_ID=CAMNT_0042464457 /DNA_START=34 /DNA_END=1050 /DNA_ORIENTATION=-
MAVDLMGGWGGGAAGGFFDDAPDEEAGQPATNNDYIEVTTHTDHSAEDNDKLPNPFDTFKEEEGELDPAAHMKDYEKIKAGIRQIETNARDIQKLTGKYQKSVKRKDENQAMLQELDDIMSANSRITRQIKDDLKRAKEENDQYADEHVGSSVGQWRVNQLNSCTRRFKEASLNFSQELNAFNSALRSAQGRLIDTVDDNKLSEQDKDEMLNDFDRAEAFLQEQFQISDTSDALMDRLAELEDRHQGMIKIEKSIKELQEMWMELNVLITEQQEQLDHIAKNVEETRDYVKSATKHLGEAEKHQKKSRKLQLYACACCIIILVILLIALGFGGVFSGS